MINPEEKQVVPPTAPPQTESASAPTDDQTAEQMVQLAVEATLTGIRLITT